MIVNTEGFQPCDIRGEVGETAAAPVSPALAWLLGRALAEQVPAGAQLLLAGDGRASTPALLAALQAGYGRPCLSLGPGVPTPLAYFARQYVGAHSVVVVTASHNPPHFNGFKLQLGDTPARPAQLARLRDRVQALAARGEPASQPPTSGAADPALREAVWSAYAATLLARTEPVSGVRIALDCMHGAYSGRAAGLLAQAGYQVTALRDKLLGDFGDSVPDPAVDRHLAGLAAAVQAGGDAEGASFGAALDGDGDRARFVDERGSPVDNGTLLALFARYLLETGQHGGRTQVVYDQKMRLAVVHALAAAGARPCIEKSGHCFIRARMLREDALLGGESSGHFFWGGQEVYPVPAGDCGLFATLLAGQMLRHYDCGLSELAATVPGSPFYTGDIRGLRFAGDRDALLARLATAVDRSKYRVITEDGLRIETADAFAHLRASVTESDRMTAAFDALDRAALDDMQALVIRLVTADSPDLAGQLAARLGQP